MATVDDTQAYVTGVLYNESAFPDDPSILFGIVDGAFREIADLEYQFCSINRAENRFSGGTTREQLLIFMKYITYDGNSYLSDTESGNLRTALINKLDAIDDLTYVDVEIRSSRTVT